MSCFPFRTSSRRWTSSWTSGSIYVSYFGLRTPYSFEWCRIGQPSSRRDSLYRMSLAIAAGMPCRISTSWCWLDELGAWHSSSALGPPWCEFVASTGGGSTTMNMVDGLERNFWDLFGKSSKSSTSMLPAMWSRMSFQTGMLMRSFNFSFVVWWRSTSSGTRIALFVQLPRSSHEALTTTTSSTAQGGGGSFKDRKPIGEVGCCDAWMAEQSHWWIKRWLEHRPIYLSIYLPV